jgi:hypothetical protein
MPFPNEHAARQRDPSDFEEGSFRRIHPEGVPEGIDFIIGKLKGSDKTTIQSIRFDKVKWHASDAQRWLREHGMVSANFEEAIMKALWSGIL